MPVSATLATVDHDVPAAKIAQLRSAWDSEIRPSARRALLALAMASFFGLAHLARFGTRLARGATLGLLLALALALIVRALVLRSRSRDARRTVLDTVGPTDPELAAATVRAMGLVERTEKDASAGSPALARLHLGRLLDRASLARIAERAGIAARRWSRVGFAFAAIALAAVLLEPFRVVEGLDVLSARNNLAPLALPFLDDVDITAKPPDYLHQHGQIVEPFTLAELPRGTTLTFHGKPIHRGRALVLTDGTTEVPFVDDAEGGVVARWELAETATLHVAARFGDVRIPQADEQHVTSIPDEAPEVKLEGAPRTVRMLDEPEILLSWEATDDHGLREVDLVFRSGTREMRRVLSKPQGDPQTDHGAHRLVFAQDSFFKRTFVPVEITVEARDNDPIAGPKWGKSAAVVVVPPQVGEPEAMRYAALLRARDALTDLLAERLETDAPRGKDNAAHLQREKESQERALSVIEDALGGTYGGLHFPRRASALVRGQLRRLGEALTAERKQPSPATHQKLVEETEAVLLAVDAGVRSLGAADTRRVAKRLASVADEAAEAAAAAAGQRDRDAATATARLDAAVLVLDGGGKQMLRLGELGLDLGEIVANDLRRIARSRDAKDLFHAELAARDLAARLRRPDPSFSGGGGSGGGGGGGTEAGAGGSQAGGGDPSSADDEMASGEQELEDLIREHADEMSEVEQSLERAFSQDELEQLKQEAKKHAEAIREAVRNLPRRPGEPGTAEGAAKQARDLAESMADALEQGRPKDAVQSGKEAMRALEDAKRLGQQATDSLREQSAGQRAGDAQPGLSEELKWAENALERLRKAAQDRAKGDLEQSGKREGSMAERARKLGEKGASGDGSLPEDTLDLLERAERAMRDAERALQQGQGEEGLEHQQNAQRLLEMARGERNKNDEGEGREDAGDGNGKKMAQKAEIPGKDGHKGPDDFRKRVLEGLGGSSDPLLKEAVKRYAEGLLR
jgi:hypothetical protein